MKKTILILLFTLPIIVLGVLAGETTRIVKVRGQHTVIPSSSALEWQQAPELAKEDAIKNALEKVCGSRVNIWDQVEMSSAGETFNSLTSRQIDGEIVEFEIIKEGAYKSEIRNIETIFYCEAKVTVKRGVDPDPDFVVDVVGVQDIYYENDYIKFNVTPYKDCYMKVFLFQDSKIGYRIYPNYVEEPQLLKQRETISFPINGNLKYRVAKDTDTQFEVNRLVFVFTKDERPFYRETTSRAEIEKWMALIPNNEKYIYSIAFDIRKK